MKEPQIKNPQADQSGVSFEVVQVDGHHVLHWIGWTDILRALAGMLPMTATEATERTADHVARYPRFNPAIQRPLPPS